jgi:hypothetical protein
MGLETDTTVFSEPDWEKVNPVAPPNRLHIALQISRTRQK